MDDELKRKILKARQAGMPEDLIQRLSLRDMQARETYTSPEFQASATAQPTAVKRGGFLVENLPTIGAIGGGMIGGIPGAVIGGGGGEALRQNLMGEEANLGKIGTQAALSGTAEIGGILIGKAAGKVLPPIGKAIGRITGLAPKELIQTAIPIKPSVLSQASRRGVDVYDELMNAGITGSRETMKESVEKGMDVIGNRLKTVLTKATQDGKKIATQDIIDILTPLRDKMAKTAVIGKEAVIGKINGQIKALEKLGKFVSPLEGQSQKQGISEFINFNVKDPKLAQDLLQKVRWGWKKQIEKSVGGDTVKVLNNKLAAFEMAGDALEELGSRELNLGLREVFGYPSAIAAGTFLGGPTGGLIGGGLAATQTLVRSSPEVASKLAVILNDLPKTALTVGLKRIGNQVGRVAEQMGVRLVKDIITTASPQDVGFTTNYTIEPKTESQDIKEAMPANQITNAAGATGIDQNRLRQAYLMWTYPKEAAKIKAVFDLLYGGAGNTKKSEAQVARDDVIALAQSAIGGLRNKAITTGPMARFENAKAFFNKADQNTLDFNTKIMMLKATIAKARAGTSFTPNEERLLNQYTPVVGDSWQTLTTKLNNLNDFFAKRQGVEIAPNYSGNTTLPIDTGEVVF